MCLQGNDETDAVSLSSSNYVICEKDQQSLNLRFPMHYQSSAGQ